MGSTTGEEEEWEVMGQEGRESASALSSLLAAYDACITSESSSSAEDARDGFVLVLLVAAGGLVRCLALVFGRVNLLDARHQGGGGGMQRLVTFLQGSSFCKVEYDTGSFGQ